MSVPGPWSALILIACAYRVWRLLAEDSILDEPRQRLVGLPPGWKEGDLIPAHYRNGLAAFINCPWCLGFWISVVLWGAWEISPFWTEVFAFPFAISAGVGIVRGKLDPPE